MAFTKEGEEVICIIGDGPFGLGDSINLDIGVVIRCVVAVIVFDTL